MAVLPALTDLRLQQATLALRACLSPESPADVSLSRFFRDNPKLGGQDRHFVAEVVFAVLRSRLTLEALLPESATPRRLLLAWLVKFNGTPIGSLEPFLQAKENRWLGEVKAAALEQLPLAARAGLPAWVVEQLALPAEEILALGRACQQAAPLDLRVNTLKDQRQAALNTLAESGIQAQATPYSPFGIRVAQKPALQQYPLFLQGHLEVQDEGSQLLGLLLSPKRGEMVVDFCAGAGGKTLLLGMLMHSTGRLYAFDINEKRLHNFKPRLKRSGLSNVQTQLIAHENDTKIKRLAGKIDRVLVDAPCSGLGTLRRNPDLRWRQSADTVTQLCAKQHTILAAAAKLLKVGGRLVYATCSLLPAENQAIIEDFLANHPHFSLVPAQEILAQAHIPLEMGDYLQLSPAHHQTDGFFAAALTRVA